MSDSFLLAHDRARGVRLIAGVDEVGRASLAGPIMAAGVLFDLERLASGAGRSLLEELDDSKRLAPAKRERLAQGVLAHAEAISLVSIPASQIDRIGIDPANAACLERALRALGEQAELRLVERPPRAWRCGACPRADRPRRRHERDHCGRLDRGQGRPRSPHGSPGRTYPGYGFERHAGYGTTEHMVAVAKLGPTPAHRLRFNVPLLAEAVVAASPRRRKPRRSAWRELPAAEMAAHLLETPTIGDRVWTDEPRRPGETRTAFIRRVLLDETEPVEAPEGTTPATGTASASAA